MQLVETHISWVLLTGEIAYKIKRPVQYPFVDLRSAQRRAFFCAEELRLNQRFAAELYLDVCDVTSSAGVVQIGGPGAVIERAVRMRQFDRRDELDRLLASGRIGLAELERFGADMAAIHAQLPVAQPDQGAGRPETVRTILLENFEQSLQAAAAFGTDAELRALREPFLARLEAAQPWIGARLLEQRVRECHGDLHSRNVVRHGGRLIAFDCMEFEPAFRWIDVADDIAFLLMDMEAQRCAAHAQAFRAGYLGRSGDYQACRVLGLYETHRALVRAKIAALEATSAADATAREVALAQHRSYLDCAQRQLAPRRPKLLLMHGLSGSGKTWLAQQLARSLGAVHLRSDVERKRLAGLAEVQHSGSAIAQGLYAPEASERTYRHLAGCAADVLAGGYTVVIDATFQRRAERERMCEVAAQSGAPLQLIHCHAARPVLEQRIAARNHAATDASEADVSVLQWQETNRDPIGTDEHLAIIDADTARADVVAAVLRQLGIGDG